ncbi:CGNR zinc finger domain-containing protein [Humibacillus xanthopallidus]|uniref:CGNR zinc finger protein n=1 Tax=Humibacillus xanthopallidus TaxID=412689 RepID=A0A543I0Q9_9MICO|nr:CGNR zinc finger domain-containing protein [Humibacillus xanthopallidus]TQM64177.1 CGNR zinc finger protein [Humibacillus xanthopallidus]
MIFTHDTEVALEAAAALVNTMPGSVPGDTSADTLTTVGQLEALFAAQHWTGRFDRDGRELAEVRAMRPRLRGLWEEGEAGVVELVNTLLAESRAVPQLVDHDDVGWHIHATAPDAPLAQRMAVEAAIAAIDVVRAGELGRLRICEAHDCDDVVIDLSRNRSRRFCEGGCAARAHTAAYRARARRAATEA